MVSLVGSYNAPLTPPRRGPGTDSAAPPRQRPTSTQERSDQSTPVGRQYPSQPPARQAIDERTGKASDLQVFRADEVPLKSVRALQAYGEVASQGKHGNGESQLAGVSIRV